MIDIAQAAEVSIATVGRVIHNNGYVSKDARERVEKAIKDMGYVPNRSARTLKQQKSGVIGSLVVYNQNHLYQKINQSLIEEVEKHGYKLQTLEGRHDHRDEEDLIDQFIGMQVDGLIITSNSFMESVHFQKLHAIKLPVVTIERTYEHPNVDSLIVKDFDGGYQATFNLILHGHEKVSLIAVRDGKPIEEDRCQGFLRALEDHKIAPNPDWIQYVKRYGIQEGFDAMKSLMSLEDSPTAVFCTADTLAAGAMQYLYQKKIRIPEDISIVGYDNVLAEQLAPPIDSIDLAIGDIGEVTVGMLLERMKNYESVGRTAYLDTLYVGRGTVINRKN